VHLFGKLKKKGRRRIRANNIEVVHFKLRPLFTTIIEGQEFRKTRETLIAKQKELKKAGKGNKSKAARALTDDEVDILYGKNFLGLSRMPRA